MIDGHLLWLMIHVAAFFQTLFFVLWSTMPWYREWIGRALWTKSFGFALYLDTAVVLHHVGPFQGQRKVLIVMFAVITLGIVSQFAALVHEVVKSRQTGNEPIRGTERR